MVPKPVVHTDSQDPLLHQLCILRNEVAHLGLELSRLLMGKLAVTNEAVAAMHQLGEPVEEICEAMADSHVVVEVLEDDYNAGWIGTSPAEPFCL
jgi:hypothetical protein